MKQIISHPALRIQGEYIPPGDKSISHRLIFLGSLANGRSEFSHFLEGEDCLGTIAAFEKMGVSFIRSPGRVVVEGVGLNGLKAPIGDLDLGNSGTTMRLILGILAGQKFSTRLIGDASLSKRPMRRVTQPLRQMGAKITGSDDANFAPLTIEGAELHGIHWKSEVPSAQVKSAILLAGLFADGETIFEEPIPSRDHTERLLTRFGAPFQRSGEKLSVRRATALTPVQFEVPGDISSAAFFITAAAILPGSELIVRNVNLNSTRTGIIEVLKAMGANLSIEIANEECEPVGTIHVKGSHLHSVTIDQRVIPTLIDELPILMIACALAKGTSVIRGAHELRVKETDRIQSMAIGLRALGVNVEERQDGCVIEGVERFGAGTISSFSDHRTAMSFAVAGLAARGDVVINDTECIATSYPDFEADFKRLVVY